MFGFRLVAGPVAFHFDTPPCSECRASAWQRHLRPDQWRAASWHVTEFTVSGRSLPSGLSRSGVVGQQHVPWGDVLRQGVTQRGRFEVGRSGRPRHVAALDTIQDSFCTLLITV